MHILITKVKTMLSWLYLSEWGKFKRRNMSLRERFFWDLLWESGSFLSRYVLTILKPVLRWKISNYLGIERVQTESKNPNLLWRRVTIGSVLAIVNKRPPWLWRQTNFFAIYDSHVSILGLGCARLRPFRLKVQHHCYHLKFEDQGRFLITILSIYCILANCHLHGNFRPYVELSGKRNNTSIKVYFREILILILITPME